MQKYIFSGNLGRDAEVKQTQSGKVVCGFSVAVQDGYGDNQKTKWVKCSLWGKRAEGKLPQYLTTGARVIVTGNPQAECWNNKEGVAQGSLAVFVDDIELIGSGEPKAAPQQPVNQQPAPQAATQAPKPGHYPNDQSSCPDCGGNNPDCPTCGIPF